MRALMMHKQCSFSQLLSFSFTHQFKTPLHLIINYKVAVCNSNTNVFSLVLVFFGFFYKGFIPQTQCKLSHFTVMHLTTAAKKSQRKITEKAHSSLVFFLFRLSKLVTWLT